MKTKAILTLLSITLLISCGGEESSIGDQHLRKGEYQQAVDAYTEYLKLNPADLKTIYNRGRAYEELQQYEKALVDFNTVLKKDPLNASAYISVGKDFYYRKSDYENAHYNFDLAIKYDKNNPNALYLRGKANQKLGNLDDALDDYNSALSINDNLAEAYMARGSLKIFKKQKRSACQDFSSARRLGLEEAEDVIKKYCK
ncbi:MAG: tetratricopeptide repeat protein [Bacteroidota bacterium]